ncbi:MAG: hypothetical protein EBX39_13515, partial [Actinobacteria bacterium]|nr:hypothetical protein [Actinomycetota bacterium]
PLSSIDVTFDSAIDPATFTAADVRITTPTGGTVTISSVRQVSPTIYRLSFTQQRYPGAYAFSIGPDIRDPAGNLLDQDADGSAGETGADVFSGSVRVGTVDLVVSDVTVAKTSTTSGSYDTVVSWTTHNLGDSPAVNYRVDSIRLTRVSDGAYGGYGDLWDYTVIPAGGSRRLSATVQVVDGSNGAGDFRVTVTADAYSYVEEYRFDGATPVRSEDNNATDSPTTLSSTLAAYPDLVVRGLGIVESTLTPGGTMTIRWNDVNQGGTSTHSRNQWQSWYDLVRVVDATTGRTLAEDIVWSEQKAVAVGGSLARQYAFTLPSDFDPTTAHLEVTVTADGWGWLPEYDASGSLDGNNAATIVWTATPTVPDLTVSGLTVDQASLSAGGQVTV